MADRFVRKTGSDSNGGTGPSDAWLTFGKASGASGAASGDVVYFGAGAYREVVSIAMTSPAAETKFVADVDGAKTGDAGEVSLTAYTTNDKTTPSTTLLLNLNGKSNLTFEKWLFMGANAAPGLVQATTSNSINITFRDCTFFNGRAAGSVLVNHAGLANVAANWLIERCIFVDNNAFCIVTAPPTSASADYDIGFVIRNCLFFATGGGVQVNPSGALAFKPGGCQMLNCTYFGAGIACQIGSNGSTTIPCVFYNGVILGPTTALQAQTSGFLVEDYNYIFASTPRTLVPTGSNSQVGPAYAPLLELGQAFLQGRFVRPFASPAAGSPVLGFGNFAGAPTTDILNRPRPAGGASLLAGVGCHERHDTAVTSIAADGDGGVGAAYLLTGPSDMDLAIPVDASALVISIKTKWDANHGNTNKPQVELLANATIGVTGQTVTAAGTAGSAYETLTLASITPTAKGWVILRLKNRAAAGNGLAWYDSVVFA